MKEMRNKHSDTEEDCSWPRGQSVQTLWVLLDHHGGQCGWSCRVKIRKLGRSKGGLYPESQRKLGPVDTLTLDF